MKKKILEGKPPYANYLQPKTINKGTLNNLLGDFGKSEKQPQRNLHKIDQQNCCGIPTNTW